MVSPLETWPPSANAGEDQVVIEATNVQLNGSGSNDANGDMLTYSWNQTGDGSLVDLLNADTSNPSFTAPSVSAAGEVLQFTLTVDDGEFQSNDIVLVTISDDQIPQNIATLASAIVSTSGPSGPDQGPEKAVDGVADGFPGDFTREWATAGGAAGSWIQLDWPTEYIVSQVTLNDRPNNFDRVTSGTLLFSDGSTVNVGSLPNNSNPLTLNFTPRSTTSVRFTINSVANNNGNIGLAEIQITGVADGNQPPSASAGGNQAVVENSLVMLDAGASSDPENDPITFSWVQTSGPSVGALTNTATPTFTAPAVAAGSETLSFEVTVNDGEFDDTATVDVVVFPIGAALPTANAGGDQITRGGELIELNASLSLDTTGYSWDTDGWTVGLTEQYDQ